MQFSAVHTDARGTIFLLKIDDREFLLLETKKGHSRGGDYHESVQHDVVLTGEVEFLRKTENGVEKDCLVEGDTIVFLRRQPHMFTALTDCLVLEWLEGPFEKTYYEPFRKLVK